MKISKRRYEEKLAAVRWKALGEGQERGRQEMADMACDWFGKQRARSANTSRHDTLLFAQSFAEGQRLLAYAYDETDVEEAIAFQQRFFDSRIIPPATEKFPNISPANYSELKAGYPDTVLFFRLSDNYAVYNDDAKVMMKLFSINQPSALMDWYNEKVPVLHFKRGEVSGFTQGFNCELPTGGLMRVVTAVLFIILFAAAPAGSADNKWYIGDERCPPPKDDGTYSAPYNALEHRHEYPVFTGADKPGWSCSYQREDGVVVQYGDSRTPQQQWLAVWGDEDDR